jgi:Ca2+-binding RTX toxin-like protein
LLLDNGALMGRGEALSWDARHRLRLPRRCFAVKNRTRLKVVAFLGLAALMLVSAAAAHRFVLVRGTPGDDVLTGTPSNDKVLAKPGNDSISALDGNDLIFAGWGNDNSDAGPGNDRTHGGPGNDTLLGSDGNDRLWAGYGDDNVDGGAGNDRIWVGHGADFENGGDGNDRMHALADDNLVDTVDCGPGKDVVFLNANESDVHVNCEIVRVRANVAPGEDD